MFWGVVNCNLGGESLFRCRDGKEEGEIGEGKVDSMVIY